MKCKQYRSGFDPGSSSSFTKTSELFLDLLHIDPRQIRQSGISGIGCPSYVNKGITGKQVMRGCKYLTLIDSREQVTWVDNRKAWVLENYIYTGTHSQSWTASWSHSHVWVEATLNSTTGGGGGEQLILCTSAWK